MGTYPLRILPLNFLKIHFIVRLDAVAAELLIALIVLAIVRVFLTLLVFYHLTQEDCVYDVCALGLNVVSSDAIYY